MVLVTVTFSAQHLMWTWTGLQVLLRSIRLRDRNSPVAGETHHLAMF